MPWIGEAAAEIPSAAAEGTSSVASGAGSAASGAGSTLGNVTSGLQGAANTAGTLGSEAAVAEIAAAGAQYGGPVATGSFMSQNPGAIAATGQSAQYAPEPLAATAQADPITGYAGQGAYQTSYDPLVGPGGMPQAKAAKLAARESIGESGGPAGPQSFWQGFGNYVEQHPNTVAGVANLVGGAGYQEMPTTFGPMSYNRAPASPYVGPGTGLLSQLAASYSGR